MVTQAYPAEAADFLEQALGYLNFSGGAADPTFLRNLNSLYDLILRQEADTPAWRTLGDWLRSGLDILQTTSPTFQDADQAGGVIQLAFEHVLPGYLEFHRDLLCHQSDTTLFNAFFVGRVCEAVLSQGAPWDETDRIQSAAIAKLNDYIGYRPVPVLETQKPEPYAHEWVRPVPLYVNGAGAVAGPYCEVVEKAFDLLNHTEEHLLRAAFLDPNLIDELAFDPRAYDFDHPANKRPNYHFGQWDPHHIDNKGMYRRFVVQQVTLEALMSRIDEEKSLPRDEMVFEAAAVLAGTMLMASGISGSGPETHDSTVTFATLLPHIAAYRDAFYDNLLQQLEGKHAARLQQESAQRRQPFGGARQHLNAKLARYRAAQLEHVHLAMLYARMGYHKAAAKEVEVVPVASARLLCQIDCHLTEAHRAMDTGDLEAAMTLLPKIMDLLHRAIECGAVIDPWNILGFDARFSLFPSPENSVHDHRADDLIALMDNIFNCFSRLWSDAAARDDLDLCNRVNQQFDEVTQWWHQFAVHEVSSVEAVDPRDTYRAAKHVAEALNLWHKGGAATGDIAFWANHAEMFDSPKAYALVIEALLNRKDFVASMALLVHWLSQAEQVALEQAENSFHHLSQQWLMDRLETTVDGGSEDHQATWNSVRKFFDFLEANAETYWHVPDFQFGSTSKPAAGVEPATAGDDEDLDEEDDLYSAAYEDVVYRDSTDDGFEGAVFDPDKETEDELEQEAARLAHRLAFLTVLARLWRLAAIAPLVAAKDGDEAAIEDFVATLEQWTGQAATNCRGLMALINSVESYEIPLPPGDHDSMIDYDRRRLAKDTMLEQIVTTCVENASAIRVLVAATRALAPEKPVSESLQMQDDQRLVAEVFATMLRGENRQVRTLIPQLLEALAKKPLLYVPLSKGGQAHKFLYARLRQQAIQDLLAWLPRVGLLTETCRLIETAREMERNHLVGPGAVTEFDELFKVGFKAIVENLIRSSQSWPQAKSEPGEKKPNRSLRLVECLDNITKALLVGWLKHSRTLRLSVLEKVNDKTDWQQLVAFIQDYGSDLFTQRFFNLANIRAILHQGVSHWLDTLMQEDYPPEEFRLLNDLDTKISREHATEQLSLVLEAIVENYGEYRDYNSTTTQSDRGELLYTLLDFLRLRTNYDRIAWNLKPVVWAHEVLVRDGQKEASRRWRRSLQNRTKEQAEKFRKKLAQLQRKHAMRMPTVADRIAEAFMRPLVIDRICALVEPAIEAAREGKSSNEFELLQHEAESLTREPTGVGLDVPTWLMALEEEVETARHLCHDQSERVRDAILPWYLLSWEEATRQIEEWSRQQ